MQHLGHMGLTGFATMQGGLVIFCTVMVTSVGLPLALVVFPVQFYRSVTALGLGYTVVTCTKSLYTVHMCSAFHTTIFTVSRMRSRGGCSRPQHAAAAKLTVCLPHAQGSKQLFMKQC